VYRCGLYPFSVTESELLLRIEIGLHRPEVCLAFSDPEEDEFGAVGFQAEVGEERAVFERLLFELNVFDPFGSSCDAEYFPVFFAYKPELYVGILYNLFIDVLNRPCLEVEPGLVCEPHPERPYPGLAFVVGRDPGDRVLGCEFNARIEIHDLSQV
jgi:hypothetical protein